MFEPKVMVEGEDVSFDYTHPLYCPVFDMPKIDKSKKKKEKKGEGSI